MKKKFDEAVQMASMLNDVFNNSPENSDSLTGYSKTTAVVSRTYIEESIRDEDIMQPLMQTINQIYLGYVLTALQLNNVIDNYSVVRNAIRRVATESFVDMESFIADNFGEETDVSMEAEVLDMDKKVSHLAAGKVIEFDFIVSTDDKGKPVTVKVPIHVSLVPNAITPSVAQAFLERNFTPSASVRLKKWKAGEISFFRDLIMSRDLTDKYVKAIREDKTNVLKDMVGHNNKGKRKNILASLDKPKNNIASSILVIDKRTLDTASHESNFDFKNYKDRQRFFDDSLSIMCVVVDSLYDNIDIYYNSLQQHSSFSFRDMEKSGAGSTGGIDMKMLMNTLSKGQAPRF